MVVRLADGAGVIFPRLKLVPEEENEKDLLNCPTSEGEVTAASILVASDPVALSPDDNGLGAVVGASGFKLMREPCLAWLSVTGGIPV